MILLLKIIIIAFYKQFEERFAKFVASVHFEAVEHMRQLCNPLTEL